MIPKAGDRNSTEKPSCYLGSFGESMKTVATVLTTDEMKAMVDDMIKGLYKLMLLLILCFI